VSEANGAASWIGRTIDGRYRIDALLGEGGMGAVFVAEHLRLGKPVALKMILPEHAGNAELATRFARESMVTASLEHPHIVTALDTGSLPDGGAYLVMTLAAGESLRAVMSTRTGARFACEVGAQIADALSLAHARSVVHRDLKPDNVMIEVRDDGALHARILDFGIARATDVATTAGGTPLTRLGTILGTPGYMPPEQALGDTVDHRADLYSLGVLLWEMTSGRPLFGQGDLREIALAQLTEPVPPLTYEHAPAELGALIDSLLMPTRDERPSSAAEVRDRLRAIQLVALAAVPAGRGSMSAQQISIAGIAKTEYAGAVPSGASMPVVTGPAASEAVLSGVASTASSATGSSATGSSATGSSAVVAGREAVEVGARLLVQGTRQTLASPRGRALMIGGAALLVVLACGGFVTQACGGESTPVVAMEPAPPVASPGILDTAIAAFAGPLADVPSDLRPDVGTLIDDDDDDARAASAARVAPARDRVPPFAAHLSDYELASGCEARRDAVRALREDGDVRAIPALQRMQDLPRRGCSPFGAGDCHRCMRRDVDRALEELVEAEHGGEEDEEDVDDEESERPRRGRGRGRGHRR
jgi:serine/threonine-protein kinase